MLALFSLCKLFGLHLSSANMTGKIFHFQIPSWLIILIFLSPNHVAGAITTDGIDWINPSMIFGPVANWMVGEQQNLSWHIYGDEDLYYLSNISLVQEPLGGDSNALSAANLNCWRCLPSGVVIYGIIYLFYMLLIFNYVKLHATLN
jgi:hypothetical protein